MQPRGQRGGDPAELKRSIERALHRDDPPHDILPMLEHLNAIAADGTDDKRYAYRRLAELLLETEPWRAAVLLRKLTAERPDDDANWALMGLAQALLGHHRFAVSSYRKALALDPGNPFYSHNLGHILDVALDRPADALKHLERAVRSVPDVPAIACSLIHARWRAGDVEGARRALAPLLARGRGFDPDVTALAAELDRAETKRKRRTRRRP
jgi:Flp pilus assembly protein TadD